jgi:hypothetical protein
MIRIELRKNGKDGGRSTDEFSGVLVANRR